MSIGPMQLRDLRVDPPLVLAPMAGLSHSALRQLVGKFGGCGLFYTEMLSARSLPFEAPASSSWLARGPGERPIIYQLLVSHPEEVPPALATIHTCGADGIDINMGCTAALIIKRGGGIALMREPARARAIIKGARQETNLPLLAKVRLGWNLDWDSFSGFCSMLQDSGVDALVVHPRLKEDRLKRPARWEYIARTKAFLRIPVIGNGDVDSPERAARMFRQTGCDAVMIGRAAVRQPWLFRDVATSLWGEAPIQIAPDPRGVFCDFLSLLDTTLPAEFRLPLLRHFVGYFAQNYAFGHTLWRLVHNAKSVAEAAAHADAFFQDHRPIDNRR